MRALTSARVSCRRTCARIVSAPRLRAPSHRVDPRPIASLQFSALARQSLLPRQTAQSHHPLGPLPPMRAHTRHKTLCSPAPGAAIPAVCCGLKVRNGLRRVAGRGISERQVVSFARPHPASILPAASSSGNRLCRLVQLQQHRARRISLRFRNPRRQLHHFKQTFRNAPVRVPPLNAARQIRHETPHLLSSPSLDQFRFAASQATTCNKVASQHRPDQTIAPARIVYFSAGFGSFRCCKSTTSWNSRFAAATTALSLCRPAPAGLLRDVIGRIHSRCMVQIVKRLDRLIQLKTPRPAECKALWHPAQQHRPIQRLLRLECTAPCARTHHPVGHTEVRVHWIERSFKFSSLIAVVASPCASATLAQQFVLQRQIRFQRQRFRSLYARLLAQLAPQKHPCGQQVRSARNPVRIQTAPQMHGATRAISACHA